jgi:hypothetical protein
MSSFEREGYRRKWTAVAEEMERRRALSPKRRLLADRLCQAERPQDSIAAVLDEAAGKFRHCILFRVQDNIATAWDARGWVDQTQSLVTFRGSAVSGNPLELLTIHASYRGNTPLEEAYIPFFEELGLPYPAEISLTPVEVAGRQVAILYGDGGGTGRLRGSEQEDTGLAARLSLGLTLVLIKNKIRAFDDA